MSLEVYGDEGELAPEGYVSEDCYEEELQCSHEARVILAEMRDALAKARTRWEFIGRREFDALVKRSDEWLDANTPKLNQSETWRAALAREVEERK